MLEKPDLPDQLIDSHIQAEYGLKVSKVTFLPLGYDVNTAVYRIYTLDIASYFLKLRKGSIDPITVAVPQYLSNLGISAIIAPLETQKGQLFGRLEDYTMILYPFIPGKDGYQVQLTDQQWIELGRTFKMVHTAQFPPALVPQIPRETYDTQWRESVKQFQAQVEQGHFDDITAQKLAAFIKSKRHEISRMVGRVEELAWSLQQQLQDFVLCHTDAHPGNYHIADNGKLYLVDWDNPLSLQKNVT